MICRVALFQYKEGSGDFAESVADQMVKVYAEHEGFRGVTFIGHYDKDIYGGATLWESAEAADKASESILTKHEAIVGDLVVGIVEHQQFDVYEPKA